MANCNLPTDIIAEILTRLPIKTLIRFRTVCKPWRSLFTNPNFIKSHLLKSSQSPQNASIIVHSISTDHDDIITIFRLGSIQRPLTPAIHFPETFFNMELVGSVNGLICLCDRSLGFMIVLWNPATRMCKSVPFPRKERHAEMVFVGLGYHFRVNDFRVICIFRFNRDKDVVSRFYVYYCNDDDWREIKPEFAFNVPHMWSVVTVKGVPYWMGIAVDENDENVFHEVCVSFDVEKEEFRFYSLPKYESNNDTGACLVNLRDSVVDLMFSPGPEVNKLVDVHRLDEKSGTWSKLYTVGPIPLEVQRVLHCFVSGEIVIEDVNGKLALYDPTTGRSKNLHIDKARELSYKAFGYTESLVTIQEMTSVKGDGQHELPSPSTRERLGESSFPFDDQGTSEEADKENIRKRDDFLSKGFKLKL